MALGSAALGSFPLGGARAPIITSTQPVIIPDTPEDRLLFVCFEDRMFSVGSEERSLTVRKEDRTFMVD
ncbi:MAG: hypothetical protein Hals2KO_21490 [Halioglobus sp.]